jgi:tRNA pseudouridine55 synthase
VGRELGCGAHLAALRRTAVGPFSIADGVGLDALAALDAGARDALLRPVVALVGHLPAVTLAEPAGARFRCGQTVAAPQAAAGRFRVYGTDGAFLGIGESGGGELRPRRLVRHDAAAPGVALREPCETC